MPKNKSIIRRFRIIHNQLVKRGERSTKQLKEAVEESEGYSITLRTIENDIRDLKEGETLGKPAPIETIKKKHRLTEKFDLFNQLDLKEEEIKYLKVMASSLEIYQQHGVFREFSSAIDKVLNAVNFKISLKGKAESTPYIMTDDPPKIGGAEFLPIILESIEEQRIIQFLYKTSYLPDPKTKVVEPLLLREYRGRWYVIGNYSGEDEVRCFSLDRIIGPIELKEKFTRITNFDPARYYKYSFGVTVLEDDPIEIRLEFGEQQFEYIKALPIHPSQSIIEESSTSMVVSIIIVPTFEFYYQIMGYGAGVKILSPDIVRAEFKRRLSEALDNQL